MPRVIEMSSGKPFEEVEEGTHVATIVGVYDLGTQPEDLDGKYPHPARPMVMLRFEIVDTPQSDGSPTTLVKEMALVHSDREKGSTLFNIHKAALGLTTEQLKASRKDRELTAVLGKSVMVDVGRTSGKKAKISSVSRLMKGVTPSKHQTELLSFDSDSPDAEVFHKLPGFVQKKIKESLENPAVGSDDEDEKGLEAVTF